jgi:GR25 family glycosyltransferase involved in LPS biosynthesis
MITHWFCVDDNSSKEDRQFMKATYPWMEYYLKTADEKGHRSSMNIIWNKLQTLKPSYWIHMEDDFLFYHPMDYIKQAIQVLTNNPQNVKQLVFNRNYAETIAHYSSKGHLPTTMPNIVLHDHRPHESITNYMNTHYWPHYSFRPAMTLVAPILQLGNYDSPNQFFERDYANKWNEAGYKTAFFDRITHRHIGRLTSEIATGTVKNAYELNGESQFEVVQAKAKAEVSANIKVVNLERRADRKLAMEKLLKANQINDFVFYKAVDGKTLKSTNELKKLFLDNDFGSRKGVIGCALSHYQLWKELVEDKTHDYYVIFEDDIILNGDGSQFKERLDKLKPEMMKQDVLFLGYTIFSDKREKVKDIYDTISNDTLFKVEPLNKNLYIGGTFAYSINKSGAQKLLRYIEENGIKHGIDYVMKIATNLNSCEIQPCLIMSEWYEDKKKQIDTDIQLNYDSLNFNQTVEDQLKTHFEFRQQLDQIGHDLYFYKGTVFEYMEKALKDPTCLGFNTLGFFKNKIETLTPSQYFKETDGIYIKKNTTIRLKMLCNWCSSKQLCKEWSNMYINGDEQGWKNIQMTATNDPKEIDYYVIINSPPPNASYIPEKTIVFQMEPWVADPAKNWGVKTWGEWATPDPSKFFKVFTHKTHLNNVQWQINYPFATKAILVDKQNKVASICSEKKFDEGHLLRNSFIQFADQENVIIDVWGKANYHAFQNYKGPVPDENKYNVYANYKYCLAVENNNERNYATEKIWESILCETLCFYWGCPNLEEYIDPMAFVRLPLEDPSKALKLIQQAITEDWWTQRIGIIKQMKEKILNQLGFFPLVASALPLVASALPL